MTGYRIVVGVDGSEPSMRALRWAVREAERTGGSVEAVTAWHCPTNLGVPTVAFDALSDFESDAKRILSEALADVSGLAPGVPIEPLVREGSAAEVLLQAADGADLLVVGNRGHGGFAKMLLGSVSHHCVLHALCPVVIMRDGREAAAA